MNVLITNARVVDPSQQLDAKLDLLIEDGVITRADKRIKANVETIDATGLIAVPGLIDLHTHLREPGQEHKETIATGTRAAVAGGYTAVCAMANTLPPNDERAVTEMIIAESRRNGACRVYPIGAVSKGLKGEALAELADLRTAGCVAVSDDGKPVWNAQLMRRALEYCTMLGIPVIAHEEDANLTDGGVMHEGYFSTLLGMGGIPAASEETLVARDVILARVTDAHVHIAHVSTAGAVESVRNARAAGVHVTCEVTPHHIALGDDSVQSFSTNLKMNPPLRSKEHRDALLAGIADGTIDAIATDHAPHHFDEKNVEFDLAPFGVIGLESAFPICYEHLVRAGVIDLDRLIDLMSCGPARIFNLAGVHRNDIARPRGDDDRGRCHSLRHPFAEEEDEAMTELKPKRVVIVDDSPAYCDLWSNFMIERYAATAHVETYGHPYDALPKIDDTIDLLIVDLEMPGMDGKKFVDYARAKGVPAKRIVVTSSHSADELHQRFRIGETIAVINKTEARQQEAFLMILDSVMRRS